MAAVDIRANESATYTGTESTYGTAATTARATIVTGSFQPKLMQTELPVLKESVYLHDNQTTVQGLKSDGSGCSYQTYACARAAKLSSSALTLDTWEKQLAALCGGVTPADGANVGDTNAGGTAAAPTVASGSDFAAGMWCTWPVGSTTEPGRIASVSGTTINLNPGLSTSPDGGSAAVCHMVTFYPSDTNTSSVTVQHAKAGNSSEQYEFRGCTGNISLAMARNSEVTVGFDLQAASWSQGALSLSTAVGNDGRGTPFAVVGAKTLLQAYGTATATNYHVEECSVDLKLGMAHIPSLSGTVEGTAGVMRVGERVAAEINLTVRMDTDWITGWSAQTLYQFMIAVPSGTGTSKQWFVFHAPKCQIVGNPERDFGADGRVRYKLKLLPQIDTSGSTAALRAPWAIAIG